jgi:polar amino acid transport system substrate-binding protein
MSRNTLARRTGTVAGTLAVVVLLAACSTTAPSGGSSTPKATASLNPLIKITPPTKVASIAAMVPADLRAKSAITVGLDPSLPPKEFLAADGTTIQGVDVDLVYAVGNVLGLKMKLQSGAFATLIPGAQNGRYDLLNSSMSPTLARQKVLDFVQTDLSGEQLLVKKADTGTYTSIAKLCGHVAGAVSGTNEEIDLNAQSAKCTAGGEKAITISAFPDANAVNLALLSGRVDAAFFDTPVSAYQAAQSKGKLANVGPIYRAGDEAMAMPKGTGFAKAVAAAMNSIIKSGVYKQIFDKWGLPKSSMLSKVVVNPPQG